LKAIFFKNLLIALPPLFSEKRRCNFAANLLEKKKM